MMVLMRAWRPGRWTVDAAVSVVAALITSNGSVDRLASWLPQVTTVPLALGQGLLLLARRRAPLAVLAATTAVGVFMIVAGYPNGGASFATCCAAYALAVHAQRGEPAELAATLRGAAAVLVAALALAVANTAPGARDNPRAHGQTGTWGGLWGLSIFAALIAACWVLGYAIRTRREYVAELRDRAVRLEAQQGERAARAVVDERLRIARELHDVIGHSISLIAIQAEAAGRCVRSDPQAVPGYLERISLASRQALAELRGALAVLRPDTAAELSPQPGLDQLPELVESLRAGGLHTRLEAEPMHLPPGTELAVYRIVQEALTNVLRHAGTDAKAAVTVARSGAAVRVSVLDDGAGPSGGPAASTAHGIVGMRERVAVYGGTLRTGARPGGGFEVEASIPLPEQEAR
jgi:signal transduction histidine kinase